MSNLYQDILGICEKHLSGSSQQFLDRQISAHLKKTPDNITEEDVGEIAKWSNVSGGLIMGQDKAELLAKEIFALVKTDDP